MSGFVMRSEMELTLAEALRDQRIQIANKIEDVANQVHRETGRVLRLLAKEIREGGE